MPAAVANYITNDQRIIDLDTSLHSDIITSYTADMAKYTKSSESLKTIKIYNSMCAQLAKENKKFMYSIVDKSAKKRECSSSTDWLSLANLLIKVLKISKPQAPLKSFEEENFFKLYLEDVGLLCNLCKVNYMNLNSNSMPIFKGALTENYVALAFKANELPSYYWESNSTAEIDFILNISGEIIPVEVKSSDSTKSKSLTVFMDKYNSSYGIRLSTKNFGCENKIKSVTLFAAYLIK